MKTHDKISDTEKGDIITAEKQTKMARGINALTDAIRRPQQIDDTDNSAQSNSSSIGDEVFNASASDITTENIVVTDNNGNTHTNTRVTQIVLTEQTSGRTQTFNISYT